jgi:3-methyladenine DNA glycosylase AlkD
MRRWVVRVGAAGYAPPVREPPDGQLVAQIRRLLRDAADPALAPGMQAYMKSAMPYLGVRVPMVRRLTRSAAADHPAGNVEQLRVTVRALWVTARYREERYAATALCDTTSARKVRDASLIDLYRELIISGAWWDHVDELSHRVGELLVGWPDRIRPVVAGWIPADDLWLRRSAIICQVGAKAKTDRALLADAITANLGDRDFFIRKAIGWALRDYAYTDPAWVRAFVDSQPLSPLSRREATKHL